MRRAAILASLALAGLTLSACNDASAPKSDAGGAAKVETKADESAKLSADLAAILAKAKLGPLGAETAAAVKDAVAKYSEKDALTLLGSPSAAFAGEQGKALIYLASKSAFEKFGTAQTQFVYALREARGLGAAANPQKAMEILAMPATGESRDNMWLTADLMMRQPDAQSQKDKIRALLEDAKKLGSGEAVKLLEKL
jgi:hypothetical protein